MNVLHKPVRPRVALKRILRNFGNQILPLSSANRERFKEITPSLVLKVLVEMKSWSYAENSIRNINTLKYLDHSPPWISRNLKTSFLRTVWYLNFTSTVRPYILLFWMRWKITLCISRKSRDWQHIWWVGIARWETSKCIDYVCRRLWIRSYGEGRLSKTARKYPHKGDYTEVKFLQTTNVLRTHQYRFKKNILRFLEDQKIERRCCFSLRRSLWFRLSRQKGRSHSKNHSHHQIYIIFISNL